MQKQIILIFLAGILLAGCQSGFIDLTHDMPVKKINQVPAGKYIGIAWANKNTIVTVVDEGSYIDKGGLFRNQLKIGLLDITTNKLTSAPFDTTCNTFGIRSLQVLPNKQIGYIFNCPIPDFPIQIIKELNLTSAESNNIYTESSIRFLGEFAYSSDMRELILADVRGLYLKSSLYLLDANGKKTNITPDFLRADFPVWSQKNDLVAFLGTKPYPGSDDEIKHFSQTESRLDYPWRLYLYDSQSLTTEELSLDIVHPSSLKWSPDGNMLAFSGEYKSVPGIWIVDNLDNPDNLTITRMVKGLAAFDFSPDGKSIAFAYIGLQNKDKQNRLYIVNLPGRM